MVYRGSPVWQPPLWDKETPCLPGEINLRGSHNPLLSFDSLLEELPEFRKTVYLLFIASADDHPMAESKELKSLLMKVKEKSGKAGLQLNIQKSKIMASGPITSWQIDGETVETVTDFILGAPKSLQMVTSAMKWKDACSLEEKLWLT